MPIIPVIQAYYANKDTSTAMRHRDNVLKQTLDIFAKGAGVKKSEFANSRNHISHHRDMGLFKDCRDTALSISTDGAQLTMKKQSNMWLLIVVLLNLPPEMSYKSKNVIIPLAIPGPSAPKSIESFVYPLFQELAAASVGMWTWDAIDSSYFVLRAYLCGVKGDMPGSAKLSGMGGHSAFYGDCFSLVHGPCTSQNRARLYYPISPPQREIYNSGHPIIDFTHFLWRTQGQYWKTIEELESARTEKERQKIAYSSGISRFSICAASPAFSHPSFFPLDPFHLFYENCMAFIWELWVKKSNTNEIIHMDSDMASQFGEEVEKAVKTLPSSFCGLVHNPYTKCSSQYKVYEWMALLHWYIIPIAAELGFNIEVLRNFAQFVDIVEVAMSHSPKSDDDLASLYNLIKSFLQGFERLYVGSSAAKVSRCRLCIWQLIHVPLHIQWNGSIRFGSQATVERAIGEIGHNVRSKKAPFANIATMIFNRANAKMLTLQYPSLIVSPKEKKRREHLYQSLPIKKVELDHPGDYYEHLAAIFDYLEEEFDTQVAIQRWGKCILPRDVTLRSRISEEAGLASRSSRYFEAQREGPILGEGPIFGEALAFYSLPDNNCNLVVYHQLEKTLDILGRWCGEWSEDYEVLKTSSLTKLVGVWEWESRVHILRKHAGLEMLDVEECEIEEEE